MPFALKLELLTLFLIRALGICKTQHVIPAYLLHTSKKLWMSVVSTKYFAIFTISVKDSDYSCNNCLVVAVHQHISANDASFPSTTLLALDSFLACHQSNYEANFADGFRRRSTKKNDPGQPELPTSQAPKTPRNERGSFKPLSKKFDLVLQVGYSLRCTKSYCTSPRCTIEVLCHIW